MLQHLERLGGRSRAWLAYLTRLTSSALTPMTASEDDCCDDDEDSDGDDNDDDNGAESRRSRKPAAESSYLCSLDVPVSAGRSQLVRCYRSATGIFLSDSDPSERSLLCTTAAAGKHSVCVVTIAIGLAASPPPFDMLTGPLGHLLTYDFRHVNRASSELSRQRANGVRQTLLARRTSSSRDRARD